ncbi:hypothetical protein [Ferroacidibacillus organovorans]|nr:hypothetical protein [Ferroacidibacillus organovorans]
MILLNWLAILDAISIPAAFVAGRYSTRFRFVRVRRRYKQNVDSFIRGR